ncbi:MAG: LysR family transcriptional regulator [Pseudonocardiales bacterium]|nr:MAG: LysR family transcriptional regulator [Pseudonocardiales bacterium]
MELRQLRYFEAVIRCGGFTRAATQLHVAQPAVSAQIQRLETELGVALMARTTRRVSLTPAGELFLTRVQRVLGELDAARGELAELAAVLRGRVTIGATEVLGPFDLPAALADFHSRYPGVALVLRCGLIADLLAGLDASEVDLVLGPIHTDLASRYSAQPLFDEQLVLITPPGHRLARERRLTLSQLREEPFVCLPPHSGLRAILDAAAASDGFEPVVQFETHSPSSIRDLVSSGLGVALLAYSAATTPGSPIAVHTMDPPPQHPPIGLIHHRDRRLTPAARTCRHHLAGSR